MLKQNDGVKEPVVLEGFLLNCSSPDATSLAITVDCTKLRGNSYLVLIRELEDALSEMDRSHAERESRGRSLRGRYRRHLAGKDILRSRRLTLIPYPSNITNRVGNLRRELYYAINRVCLDLQREQTGRKHRVIYLLPYSKAPEMMILLESLNKEIDEINGELTQLRELEVPKILAILHKYELNEGTIPDSLHSFDLNLRPVRLDPNIVEEIVETRYREQFSRLKETEQRGLELLRQELEEQRRTLVTAAIEKLRKQIEAVASRMIGTKKWSPKTAKEDIQRIREIAESTGLGALARTVLDPLVAVIDEPSKAEEILGSRNVVEGINGRIQGLLASL